MPEPKSKANIVKRLTAERRRLESNFAPLSPEEMLERGRYEFTGRAAVYDWLQAYAAHDMWGKTKIRAWVKARQPG
jgi:hypothetical protein